MIKDVTIGSKVSHYRYGEGIVAEVGLTGYEIYFEHGGKVNINKNDDDLEVIEKNPEAKAAPSLDLEQMEELFSYLLDKNGMLQEVVEMGEKWEGGTLLLQPANKELQAKEIPVETFFHKIVMLRDRLRVLEQNINSHKSLSDEEKVHLQQYITRAYGSLTTFNVLFSDKKDYFKGSGK
jgi:hypothetical protein